MEDHEGCAVAPEQVASAADPAPLLAQLRGVGVGRLPDGRWLVSDPAAAERILSSPSAAVAPPDSDDPVVAVQARMARFSDGEAHARRRAHATAALDGIDADMARGRAHQCTERALAGATTVDVMELARRIPVLVVAELLGLAESERALAAVDRLCRRLAPRLDDGPRPGTAEVMQGLQEAFGDLDEASVNRLALLFQALDATAALVGLAAHHLLAGAPGADRPAVTAADIERVARLDPPVHLTARRTTHDVAATDSATIPGGSTVVVCLAAAEGPPRADGPMTFGHGPHACPGRHLAVGMATGIVQALAARGAVRWTSPSFEPRPNLRLARELIVQLAPDTEVTPGPSSPPTGEHMTPATRFRRLHDDGFFVMPNAWDIGSAVGLERLGFPALATTSSGHAAALGRNDQEVRLDELCAHVEALVATVGVPLSVDSERLFADTPDGVAATVATLADLGASGVSIEDYDPATGTIDALEDATARVAAAAAAAREHDVVLTARAENLLFGIDDLDDTIARLRAYRAAGADVCYAPGLVRADDIARVVREVGGPVNVLLMPDAPAPAQLAGLGVRRASTGGRLARTAYRAAMDAAAALLPTSVPATEPA